jgi:AcrR family transcriptional regulator
VARKTKADWLEAGMEALATQGVDALTIDRVAEALGVTKGSFYHHFKSQADYRDALLAFWEQEGLVRIPATPETAGEALANMDRIVELSPISTRRKDPGLAIRSWAARDPSVRAFVERVDKRRLKYAEDFIAVIVGDRQRARHLARMLYALILGSGHMLPPVKHKGMLEFYEEFRRLLVTHGSEGDEPAGENESPPPASGSSPT